ncbi:MAG: SpoIVB peptidase [Huintestinicola sp.]
MKVAIRLLRTAAMTVLAVITGCIIYYNVTLPDNYYVASGGELKFSDHLLVTDSTVLPKNYSLAGESNKGSRTVYSASSGSGRKRESLLSLFGIFPIKDVTITEVDTPMVIPCGNPFGIKMTTDGVMVVELSGFDNGVSLVSPAKEAGICEGDLIVSISGKKVSSNKDIGRIIADSKGDMLGVKIIRDGESRVLFLKPQISAEDNTYHAGMWVRDSSAGIGTLTFYDPVTGIFGGLGHPVCDCDTGEVLTMAKGQSADVYISGVKKSREGEPGELVGSFISNGSSGTLELNCEAGLFGYMDCIPSDNDAVEAAMRQEIKTGKASIYTTIDGTMPKEYEITIEKIDMSDSGSSRNMVIRVTDPELLEKTGGIVQGMSGSPIMQNGKLIGAVTHVFVSDPRKGYAIFADTMIDYAKKTAQMTEQTEEYFSLAG